MFKRKPRRSREFEKSNQVIDFENARKRRQQRRESLSKKTPEKEQISKRKAGKKNRKIGIYTAICFIIIAVIGLYTYNILAIQKERAEVLQETADLEKEKKELTEELANVDTPEYIEQQARAVLRMIKPGEYLYVLPASDGGIKQ